MDTNLKNPTTKRIEYIDTAKAFGICAVILGHTVLPDELKIWIYSFHIPLFFFLTGLTFRVCSVRDFVKKRAVSLLIPYFLFSLLYVIKDLAAYFILHDGSLNVIGKKALGILLCVKNSDYCVSIMWFLPCLFVSEALLLAIIKLFKDKKLPVMLAATALCAVGCLASYLKWVSLPWYGEVAAVALLFMAVGYTHKERINRLILGLNGVRSAVLIIASLAMSVATAYLNFATTEKRVEFSYGEYANVLLTIVDAFFGIMFVLALCNSVNTRLSLYIGQNSLFIYSFHYFFFMGNMDKKLCGLLLSVVKNSYVAGIVSSLVFLLIVAAVCCVLAKPYNAVMNKVKEKILS